ncbi:MAG TPA: GAP family protein [Gaiellaceae bacterium]|nr:GAP family protein [Gaiellaceae bacterium]
MSAEVVTVVVLGLGCAANPWGIMIAVLLLDARRGHGIVWTYVVAWVTAISVVLAVLLSSLGALFAAGSDDASSAASIIELVLGVALLTWGVVRIRQARQEAGTTSAGAPARELPRWLRAIENLSYPAAFLLGIYSATYPFVIAASTEILKADGGSGEMAALALLFVALGSSSVVLVAALGTFAPDRSGAYLARMRMWLTLHNRAVITAILLVFGVSLAVRGASGLA